MRLGWRVFLSTLMLFTLFGQISYSASLHESDQHQVSKPQTRQFAQLVFCVPPEVWSKKRKRCVNPFVKTRKRCKAPRVWSKKQRRCAFPVVEDARCGPKEVWSKDVDSCVCRPGYERGEAGCQVVADEPIGPDYAEIQRCLNQLGFNSGAVDGQPGQRTRRAWNQFRAEVGLGNRAAPLTDEATQKRLFEECEADRPGAAQKADNQSQSSAEADSNDSEPDKPQAQPQPTSAADTGVYSDVMCVSKGLKKALSRIVGTRKSLAVCGETCVPIPPGMTEQQLKQSEEEYSVTWCRNCIRIGKAGIVCGRNP